MTDPTAVAAVAAEPREYRAGLTYASWLSNEAILSEIELAISNYLFTRSLRVQKRRFPRTAEEKEQKLAKYLATHHECVSELRRRLNPEFNPELARLAQRPAPAIDRAAWETAKATLRNISPNSMMFDNQVSHALKALDALVAPLLTPAPGGSSDDQ